MSGLDSGPERRDPEEALLEEIEIIVRLQNAIRKQAGPDASPAQRGAAFEELLAADREFAELAERLADLDARGEAKLLDGILADADGDEEAARGFPRISVWRPEG